MWRLIAKRTTPIAAIIAVHAYNSSSTREKRHPIYFWGSNVYGLASPDSTVPASIIKQPHQCFFWSNQGLSIIALCASERHAACLDDKGDLWQWGEDAKTLRPVRRVQGKGLTSLACNDQVIFATDAKGTVTLIPVDLDEELQQVECEEPMKALSCGHDHILGLSKSGKLYTAAINTCGNAYGQLGIGLIEADTKAVPKKGTIASVVFDWPRESATSSSTVEPNEADQERQVHDPISFQHIPIKDEITDIAAGAHHSLALTKSGVVYAFGSNSNLQLGLGRNASAACALPTPLFYQSLPRITQIAAAGNTSFFLSNQTERTLLYAAGNGLYGQLGIGGFHHAVGEPALIPAVSNQFFFNESNGQRMPISIKGLWAGPSNAAVLMNTFHQSTHIENGAMGFDLLAWGCNKHYQIAATTHANVSTPSTVRPPSPTSATVGSDDLALSTQGPTTTNPEGTLSFQGGQLQVLPDSEGKPAHRLFIAPEFNCIY